MSESVVDTCVCTYFHVPTGSYVKYMYYVVFDCTWLACGELKVFVQYMKH